MQSSTLGRCRVPFLTLGLVVVEALVVVVEVLLLLAACCFFLLSVCLSRPGMYVPVPDRKPNSMCREVA